MRAVSPEERHRERSILFALTADSSIVLPILLAGLIGGSLTSLAEAIRGILMIAIEGYSLVVLRRIHRGLLVEFEFGAGKLEQMCNLIIAAGMVGGAAWIAHGAFSLLLEGQSHASPLGLATAACLGAINTFINFAAWDEIRQAAKGERSLIMQAQLRARFTKLVSSAFVQVTMTISAVANDPVIAAYSDLVGALFVSGFILLIAIRMFRAGLPDLLDRAVDEAAQILILRALIHHFDAYDSLDGIRTRRSGSRLFVEIALGFDQSLSMAEVDRRVVGIRQMIMGELPSTDVSILAAAVPPLR
ncbi:MAG TPA: cation transporter [Geminicoccus sp.]|jgi:divalent metal cation (Fe/Co/Zn/Cd) transporter|uniref:cation diffusion facilitator family transporter n=1 Tax=Geminicoccus sp. TaxID=2024832 RepID=UPI002E37A400|nr:cation transporter [Geminicoccus sp.]HEX2524884.1 cation transporter [Geminicoccus sp.]